MTNFLDSYVRLRIFYGEKIKVVYYLNGIKKELQGYLYSVVGSDYIICYDGDKKEKITFFDKDCMIKSIELCNKDECCDKEDALLFYNPYDFSRESSFEEIKKKLFGTDIVYSNDTGKSFNPFFRFPYKKMFSSKNQREEFFNFLKLIIVELSDYCKKNNLNPELSLFGIGSTSLVMSIGDKIVKFGIKRRVEKLPYCEYFLQPLFNRDFMFGDRVIHLEVTQKVKDGTKEDAIFLKYQLLNIGLAPIDVDTFNVGFLDSKSDNRIQYKDNIFYDTASEKSTSIDGNSNLHLSSSSKDKPFNGKFPVVRGLDEVYIIDIEKYSTYLRKVGFNEDIINEIKYNFNKKRGSHK